MALETGITGGGNGVALLVSAGVVFEIMAAFASSPQTTELNADKRAATLMKWVHSGVLVAGLFVGLACIAQPRQAKAILVGGVLAGGILEYAYIYAKNSGLKNPGSPTEVYRS